MKNRSILFIISIFILCKANSQWSVQPGIGIATPITGYKTMVNSGRVLQIDGTKRLKNNRWGIGLMLAWARMHDDNNSSDKFQNVKLEQIPILVSADYELLKKRFIPY